MCGIVGFLGEGNAYQNIYNGLVQLQNRGYDSAGITIIKDNCFITNKHASQQDKSALEVLKDKDQDSSIGIGHTRWATHGAKTDVNSHPHQSFDGIFTIVHNGIIENYQNLKSFLASKGIESVSQTDTEIIANLLAYYYAENKNVEISLKKLTEQLKGTWGLAILCIHEPNKIYCTRHGSPLLVGIENNMIMITSEQSGFCNLFNKYIVLNNQDICILEYNENKHEVSIETKDNYIEKTSLDINNALTPAPYDHWTLKEIFEQIDSTMRVISLGGRILSNNEVKLGGLTDHTEYLLHLDNLILLGCGTSYHSGMIALHFLKDISEFNSVQLFDGADFSSKDIPKIGKTGLLMISQSGETKDLHRCVKIAQENDLYMIGVVNVVDSLIAREVHCGSYLNAGREVAVASTKAFTSQSILLTMMATWFAQNRGKHELKRIKIIKDLRNLHMDIKTTLEASESQIKKILPLFDNQNHCFILGKGKGESVAKEGALKIKEISYIHAEGYSTSSLKHGPFALLEKDFPVILLGPEDEFYNKTMNAYEEIQSRHARIIMITDDDKCKKENIIKIPLNETFRHLLCVIPLQLLAYELSVRKEINPDMPRNLAKVVTVE